MKALKRLVIMPKQHDSSQVAGAVIGLRAHIDSNTAGPALLVIHIIALCILGHEHNVGGHGPEHVHSSGHRDAHQPVQPSGQTRRNISRDILAPGVAFFFDVGFILHTTKIVLLKVNFPCWLRIDSNHGR